jgi:dipeptidyl aminopeptidase/acylaminoacyl peptidase
MKAAEDLVNIPLVALPIWSPSSDALAFLLDESGRGSRLWRCDLAGGELRQLSNAPVMTSRPAWSPDGRWIAVTRANQGGGSGIWLVDAGGSGEERQIAGGAWETRSPSFSPDGTLIAFLSGEAGALDVWVVPVDGGGAPRQLTRDTNPLDEPRWTPRWSPDGNWIAYVSSRSGERNNDDLWLVNRAGDRDWQLTTGLLVSTDPAWSPDGRSLAFTANTAAEHWYGDDLDLWQVPVEPGPPQRLSPGGGHSRNEGARPGFSPDGRAVYALTLRNGDKNVTAIPAGGGVRTAATNLRGTVSDFLLSPDGEHLVIVFGSQTGPNDLYLVPAAGGRPRRLTAAGDALSVTLREPERVPYRSFDGLYCDAYLYLPPGFDESKRYPGLVQVHGGGTNAYSNGWHPVEQWLAQHGFVVMAVEYRGSSGYGRDFAGLSYGDWGGGQTTDSVVAGRWLQSQPYIGKVGIYGGSYGGYLTLHSIVADPELFSAAVDMYGMTNKESGAKYADRVGRIFVSRDYWGRMPSEMPELMKRAGTHERLHRIRTPLLILHGEVDRRVPLEQSDQVAAAMKAANLPHEYVIYPGEGHGFRKREHRIDSYNRMLGWFQRNLME